MLLLLLACVPTKVGLDDTATTDTSDTSHETGDSSDTSHDTSGGACAPGGELARGLVTTTAGPFQGSSVGEGWAFLGLPFAAPPVGELRLRPPAAPGCVEAVRAADTWAPVCPQWSDAGHRALAGDEDCLYLNVWTPTSEAGAGLPVLVFVHGGGNVQGGTSADGGGFPLYEGADLAAAEGVVVVTVAYRLGALGFLATEELTGESGTSGNWGLLDQLAALEWVREHARAFGGDPERVLLFGESAGALDTCALYTSPWAEGLFSAALMQSGACVATPLREAENTGEDLAADLGCADAACLRELDWQDLAALSESPISELGVPGAGSFGPAVDGVVLPEDPWDAIVAGEQLDVPLVVGSNTDETAQWVPELTEEEYEAWVTGTLGARLGEEVLAVYPASDYASPRWAWIALTTDVSFHCPARWIHETAASTQTAPVYRYLFGNVPNGASGRSYGAWHGLELLFVFQQLQEVADATGYRVDNGDEAVEAAMGEAWAALAAGEMDSLSFPWSPDDELLLFDAGATPATDGRAAYCDFWAGL